MIDPTATVHEPVVVVKPEAIRVGRRARVDAFCKLEGGLGLTIGDHVHVASFCHLNVGGGVVALGDYSAYASGAKVLGGGNRPEGRSMSAVAPWHMQVRLPAVTLVGAYACLGVNAVVLPGVTVGEGAIVAAGAVATRAVPPWEIWGGVPARKLGDRAHAPIACPACVLLGESCPTCTMSELEVRG